MSATDDPRPLGQRIEAAEQAVIEADGLLRYHADLASRRGHEFVRRGRWLGAAAGGAVLLGLLGAMRRQAPTGTAAAVPARAPRSRTRSVVEALAKIGLMLAPLLLPALPGAEREPASMRLWRFVARRFWRG